MKKPFMPLTSGFCAAELQTLQTVMTLANDTVALGLTHSRPRGQLNEWLCCFGAA